MKIISATSFLIILCIFSQPACSQKSETKTQPVQDSVQAVQFVNVFIEGKGWRVPGQDNAFILYSPVDTGKYAAFQKDVLAMNRLAYGGDGVELTKTKENIKAFRSYLAQWVEQNDPWAQYLTAISYDLPPYSINRVEVDSAQKYYQLAADQNLSMAESFFATAYQYPILRIKKDMKKAMEYLDRSILHGDSEMKSKGYNDLARIWYSDDSAPGGKPDPDKTQMYLEKSMENSPNDSWAMDFLASVYEKKGIFDKAIELMLKSENEQSRLEAAEWMIEGKNVKKNFEKGLKIMQEEAKKIGKEWQGYMGVRNPVIMLNKLYQCEKLIKKEQAGDVIIGNMECN